MKKNAKWIVIAAVVVAVIFGGYKMLADKFGWDKGWSINYDAPEFTVVDAEGGEVDLSDYKGKPVVLSFWSTWNNVSKNHLSEFEKLSKEYPDVQILMINATDNLKETVAVAKEFIDNEGYTFEVLYDTKQEAVNHYQVKILPATFFIDKKGNLVSGTNGSMDYETLVRGIEMMVE